MEIAAIAAGALAIVYFSSSPADKSNPHKKGSKAPGQDKNEPPDTDHSSSFKSLFPPNDPKKPPAPDTGTDSNPNFPPICMLLTEANQGTANTWGRYPFGYADCEKYAHVATGPSPAWSGMYVDGKPKGSFIHTASCATAKMPDGSPACEMANIFPDPAR